MKSFRGIVRMLLVALLLGCSGKINPEKPSVNSPKAIESCSDRIVFFSSRSNNGDLYFYDPESLESGIFLSADSVLGAPRFNSFNQSLMFAQNTEKGRSIFSKNLINEKVSNVFENPAGDEVPDWSPVSNEIVYSKTINAGNFSLVVRDMITNEEKILFENGKESFFPVWSPAGDRIAFVLTTENASADIAIINKDGSGFQNLTKDKKYNGHPAWHPNEEKLLFYIFANGNADLYEMNLDSKELLQLTYDSNNQLIGRYSPDGNKIAYGGVFENDWEIFIMDADGNNKERLTYSPGFDGDPIWVPCQEEIL